MGLTRKQMLSVMGAAAAAPLLSGASKPRVIRRDVCVLGGGSAGTYAAVRLGDLGRSVVVVEALDRLGGHTETYHDPATGSTIDIGVVVFEDEPVVRDYFGRFDVGLARIADGGGGGGTTAYVDFRTGRPVDYTPAPPVALPAYFQEISRFGPIDTFFDLPDPVPAELVAPFADFVAKHDFGSVAPLVFNYGQGIGDVLGLPALYAINTFGLGVTRNILNGSFLTTAARDNSLIYERATAKLGEDVLLSTRALRIERSRSGVRVWVTGPGGPQVIEAKKLLVTIPPLVRTLGAVDLDSTERSVFGTFVSGAYYTSVVRLSGLPAGVGLDNVAAGTPYQLPPLPGIYSVAPTAVPGLYNVKYGSPSPLPDAVVRREIRAGIERVARSGTYPVRFEGFAVYKSHTPFELHVGPRDIAGGFYRRLNALQGRNHTYWSGAAWHSHNSTRIWTGLERLLPSIGA
ncbi:FAD-dependent oxidoreductase [Actinoplanes sp. M2I2]|uniref:FAD-dependent oxidoreductase n=1 Tax=Actinoplanes sp. M2I2 TaxID=1734444 RepID=UPI002022731F|nr:FAD-dependent oxidoreductase [Actinoplanes sp. M2I2]